ncbi:ankyrin repeat domain-containing protein 40 [Clupea harengus]|uniref:Ankyrin repeat domain-containing protein 40 n=1 Tax=Clupea harengus TaxID=7950 RepID=A0A6P3WCM5_CLUHA|nr:ankyrin repeat domain-containing protein 40 [Clupea harengus]
MSTTSLDKELQERLREASAIGDIDEVRKLVESGINVNSQNEINGWTCLHWACKRNHKHVVAYLLNSGADQNIVTAKEELAVQLTSKPEIRRLLGVEEEDVPELKEPELPIIPSYLSNPPFMFSKTDTDDLMLAQNGTQNGSSDHTEDPDSEPATLSPTQELSPQHPQPPPPSQTHPSAPSRASPPQQHRQSLPGPREGAFIPVSEQNGMVSTPTMNGGLPIEISPEPHHPHLLAQNGAVCPTVPSPGASSGQPPISRQPSIPQQLNGPQAAGSMPAFQPFFFTSTFPVSCQELVLKVRIQNPNTRENDFIEVEVDRQELTYRSLLRVCCRELDISAEHVEKIRKLPNTMLRKDKDVARLQDFQELEVVLEKSEGLSLFSGGAGSLADRPCYNMKASRLTY